MKTVKTLMSADDKKKVEIYVRPDGTFGFDVYKFSDDDEESSWILVGKSSADSFKSEKDAISEARDRVSWLASSE